MKCPKCHTSWICVLESRHTTPEAVSRRRKCKACDHVWATAEVVVPNEAITWKNVCRSTKRFRAEFGINEEVLKSIAQISEQTLAASSEPI